MKKAIVFLLMIICVSSSVDASYWVFFKDKDNDLSGKEWYRSPVPSEYVKSLEDEGVEIRTISKYLNAVSVNAPDDFQLEKIREMSFVAQVRRVAEYRRKVIEYLPKMGRFEDRFDEQLKQINVDLLHQQGFKGEGIRLGILDTGFETDHDALRGIKVVGKYDFINRDTVVRDEENQDSPNQSAHGSKVLSIIAGNAPGLLMGTAPECEFLLAKTELRNQEIITEEDYFVEGLEWCAENGADVITASLGYIDWYEYSDLDGRTTVSAKAVKSIGEVEDILIVISNGNEGNYLDGTLLTPADAEEALAVGSVDINGEISGFSSTGPTADGRIKPDIAARGEGTFYALPSSGNLTGQGNGTSFAAPLVAGACALIRQKNPGFTAEEIRRRIRETGSRANQPDNRYGYGILNAYAAAETEGVISGFIYNEDGVPLNGAVLFFADNESVKTTSNNYGYFMFPRKIGEQANIYVKHGGYEDKTVYVSSNPADYPLEIILESLEKKDFMIYPNPAASFLEVKFFIPVKECNLNIYRIDGSLCSSIKENFNDTEGVVRIVNPNRKNDMEVFQSTKVKSHTISLQSGVYIMELVYDGERETGKIMIK